MTVGPVRSANSELHIGLTEGKYKRVIRDRGGFVEASTQVSRASLDDTWYGIHETAVKTSPDGVTLPTRDFVETKEARLI